MEVGSSASSCTSREPRGESWKAAESLQGRTSQQSRGWSKVHAVGLEES